MSGTDHLPTFCPGCRRWASRLRPDAVGRPRGCPHCGSLERHRILTLLLPALAGHLLAEGTGSAEGTGADGATGAGGTGRLLAVHLAPTPVLDVSLDRLSVLHRVRIDLQRDPGGRRADVRAAPAALPVADAAADLLVCAHVLPFLDDDAAALAEVARVLAGHGVGVLAMPSSPGPTRDAPRATAGAGEDPRGAPGPPAPLHRYGDDVVDRFAAAGLATTTLTVPELFPPWLIDLLRLAPDERFWLVHPAAAGHPPTAAQIAPRLLAELGRSLAYAGQEVDDLRRARIEATRWQAAAMRWEERYIRLRDRRAVRVISATDRIRNRARALIGQR